VTWLIVAAVLATTACASDSDPVYGVAADDPEMNEAIAQARASLPQFWEAFESRQGGASDFALKVRIEDSDAIEHFWVIDLERTNGKVTGVINNDPETVANVKLGDVISIRDEAISDWLYMRNGKMVGNHTLRPLLSQMPKDEADQLRSMLADP
jgi:uncharacterized protein YegJ (DUF2314 family)